MNLCWARRMPGDLVFVLGMPCAATALALALIPWVPNANLALLYIGAVLLAAVNRGVVGGLAAAAISFLAYNFFLTEPQFTLHMLHQHDLLTAALLVLVALVTGHLAGHLQEKVADLKRSEAWNAQQVACANALSACHDSQNILDTFGEQLHLAMGWNVRPLDENELGALSARRPRDVEWSEDASGFTLWFTDAQSGVFGALRLVARNPVQQVHRERLRALTDIAKLAWGRVQYADALRLETLDREREQLRSALLSSVSHDLRTPLATMIGSVSSLIDLSDSLDEAQRSELLRNTLSEARRLDRYIQKLLDMTRLGHGELSLDRSWIGVDDILAVVVKRIRPLLDEYGARLEIQVAPDLPLVQVHPALIEQAIFNVMENALRFSPAGGLIELVARQEDAGVLIQVTDEGPGIAVKDREAVFDMFHTFSHGDKYASGTGLGLAICKSIVAAHQGTTDVVDSPAGKGARLQIRLPVEPHGQVQESD